MKMITILWIIIFLGLPAGVLWACSSSKFLDSIGGVVLCYALGLIIGNINILPENAFQIQDTLTTIVIPLALPLIFFSMNLNKWKRNAGKAAKTFGGAIVSVLVASVITFLMFRPYVGVEAWKISGMLIGVYSGGTPNMASVGTALNVNSTNYVAVNASDVVVGGVLFLLIISIIPKILKKFLPAYKNGSSGRTAEENRIDMQGFHPYFTGFKKNDF